MVVGGLPWEPMDDCATAGACLAWDLMQCAREKHDLTLRIGVHMGPGVAGVIGRERFIYDFWGDTVNVASRLESTGTPGQIQLSEKVAEHPALSHCIEEHGMRRARRIGRNALLVDHISNPGWGTGQIKRLTPTHPSSRIRGSLSNRNKLRMSMLSDVPFPIPRTPLFKRTVGTSFKELSRLDSDRPFLIQFIKSTFMLRQ